MPWIPRATYRLQLRPEFDFDDAAAIVPYLAELGVDTLYASPHFHATPGSTHGYDVIDPTRLNDELGGEAAYERLHQALEAHGLRLLIDIVPNHMGIAGGANGYWQDVLENGRSSRYAEYFDIDWEVTKPEQRDKVLLPILGEFYGVVLEQGELRLGYDEGRFTVHYYDTPLPIAPPSYGLILRRAVLPDDLEEPLALEFASILAAFDRLPANTERDPDLLEERRREQTITIRRLGELVAAEASIRQAIDAAITEVNGRAGESASFDALDQLLEAQSYRLAYWRVAAEEINYRRFFAINELAAVRQEVPEVFASTHSLVAELIARGYVHALRIDHIDGLWNPGGYLEALQNLAREARPDSQPFYIVVEKILEHDEELPSSWPVAGATGYEFARAVTALFVDTTGARAFTQWYERFTGNETPFEEITFESKHLILQEALSSELNVLAAALDRLSERRRRTRDFTLNNLRFALQEVIASFPVYRTYVTETSPPSPEDRRAIEAAIATAVKRNPASDRSVFGFVRDMLLGNDGEVTTEDDDERIRFAMRFQQLTGPVMAKGLEDTAFYRNYRQSALNEVGGEPETFGIEPGDFHRQIVRQWQAFPQRMLASSTHDTKRSEDVRARIATLSEFPREWRAAVNRWTRLTRKHRTRTGGASVPTRNDEALFYQSLVGIWPASAEQAPGDLADRLSAYLQKAAREAQEQTSWTNPNESYEAALDQFVHRALDPARSLAFLADFADAHREVARAGAFTSLAMQALKLTCPGVPDIYQGTETLDFSLVDPDNRRAVDFPALQRGLSSFQSLSADAARELAVHPEDGAIKLFTTARLLQLRSDHDDLFRHGDYQPLTVTGELQRHVVAFARQSGDQRLVVVVPRLIRQLIRRFGDDWLAPQTWTGTVLELPIAGEFEHALSGERFTFDDKSNLPLSELWSGFPVACLVTRLQPENV